MFLVSTICDTQLDKYFTVTWHSAITDLTSCRRGFTAVGGVWTGSPVFA